MALVVLAAVAEMPLAAQSTNTGAATPTPTPSPPATGNAVGPPQLRDFNLNGTVTQPTPTPSPATTAPAPTDPATAPRAAPSPPPAASRVSPVQRPPAIAVPDRDPSPGELTADLPPPPAAPIAVEPSFGPSPAPAPAREASAEPPLAGDAADLDWRPWLAALLALALGAAFLWWRRQPHGEARHAADGDDIGALVAAPAGTPAPLPRAVAPAPAVSPRVTVPNKATTPARPLPRGASPAPAPAAIPAPAPSPPAQPIAGGIVASGLKPRIEFDLVPVRAETDAAEGAALTFEIIIVNAGSAPARDVLVEAQLINAGPQVDAEVGRFFSQPAGGGERVPMIPPMGRAAISTRLAVPGASLSPLVVEGRKLLVPVVAINVLYRWNGTEVRESSSFLVGRGEREQGKLAPFRLDRGARSWSGLAARLHSSGLQR